MPDTDPNNAPDDLTPRTDDSVAKQVENVGEDTTPGGGGLGGAAAADALGGSMRAPEGASPNSPIDIGVAAPDGNGEGETREAQLRSLNTSPEEPQPKSQ